MSEEIVELADVAAFRAYLQASLPEGEPRDNLPDAILQGLHRNSENEGFALTAGRYVVRNEDVDAFSVLSAAAVGVVAAATATNPWIAIAAAVTATVSAVVGCFRNGAKLSEQQLRVLLMVRIAEPVKEMDLLRLLRATKPPEEWTLEEVRDELTALKTVRTTRKVTFFVVQDGEGAWMLNGDI